MIKEQAHLTIRLIVHITLISNVNHDYRWSQKIRFGDVSEGSSTIPVPYHILQYIAPHNMTKLFDKRSQDPHRFTSKRSLPPNGHSL